MDISLKQKRTVNLSYLVTRLTKIKWRRQFVAYSFQLPALILFSLFAWYPVYSMIRMSFHFQPNPRAPWTYVGLENYQLMWEDPLFLTAWQNAIEFVSISLLVGFLPPVLVAIFANEMRFAKGFFRLVYFLPGVIPGVVSIRIWQQIYSLDHGHLNIVLGYAGIPAQSWLQDPVLMKWSMIVIATWGGLGGAMLVYLAALQDIPPHLYEAAEIDGASFVQRIRFITFPHLRPLLYIMLISQVMGVTQIFAEPFLLAPGGGPNNTVSTPVTTIYEIAFHGRFVDFGLASAWSVVLMIVLMIFSIFSLRSTGILGRKKA